MVHGPIYGRFMDFYVFLNLYIERKPFTYFELGLPVLDQRPVHRLRNFGASIVLMSAKFRKQGDNRNEISCPVDEISCH